VLSEAVRAYDQCLALPELDTETRAGARHNLELAKLLWLQAQPSPRDKPEERPRGSEQDNPPRGKQQDDPRSQPGIDPMNGGTHGQAGKTPIDRRPGDQPTPINESPPAGTGNLPPVPDDVEVRPLTVKDAMEHLDQATTRILQERRQYRIRTAKPPTGNVKDW
jgi:hypothetical protein